MTSCRTYEQAVEFIFGRINFERVADGAYSAGDLKLDRMRRLLALLDDPQQRVPAVHIAGTKGKGSTAVMVAEILSAAGHTTGLFTSPHIAAFEERIRVDGVSPSPADLIELVNELAGPVESLDRSTGGKGPTYFELATALAWLYFRQRGVDVAVLEVGLGGRLDATNICRPLVTVITNISRDHTGLLGSTPAQIAREKAGIVKAGVPMISGVAPGPAAEAVADACRETGSPLYRLGEEIRWRPAWPPQEAATIAAAAAAPHSGAIRVETPWGTWDPVPVPLRGVHQQANAALAVAAAGLVAHHGFPIEPGELARGMASVRWPARIEVVGRRPTVVIDAAHNWASAEALLRTLDAEFPARRRVLVFAATRDKDVEGLLRLLLPRFDSVVLTQYEDNPRAVGAHELASRVQRIEQRPYHVSPDAAAAWRLARLLAGAGDLICITGSFFIAAQLRQAIVDAQAQPAGAAGSIML
jgi:dihydrofolate synthase/folylpolyglutamate synthase